MHGRLGMTRVLTAYSTVSSTDFRLNVEWSACCVLTCACRWSLSLIEKNFENRFRSQVRLLRGFLFTLEIAADSCSALNLISLAARSMEDLPAADAPIKVYENTYITKPNDNQR